MPWSGQTPRRCLIERQEERVEALARDGHPTKLHEEDLNALREAEETMKETREAVQKELDAATDE